jgi:ATP-dependent DNA helicase DinG
MGYIFPNDFVIFDEAHTLEDVAASQLGLRLSQSGLRFDVSRLYNPRNKKGLLKQLRCGEGIQAAEELLERSQDFFDELQESVQFGQYSKESRVREADIVDNTLAEPLRKLWDKVEDEAEKLEKESSARKELMDGARRLREVHGTLRLFLDQTDEESVYWIEKSGRDGDVLSLRSAPINVADRLRELMFGKGRTCILTSATLSAGEEDMSYFRRRVGAEHAKAVQIGSPFDYKKQMEIYVMQAMPDPGTPTYEEALVHWIGRVLKYTEGKAFVLFTSYKVMRNVADAMKDYFEEMDWRLLVQGDGTPRHKMVEIFREDIHSVLFGTASFWAGVDVPGESLSNVIVTRLPFSVPDHPVVQSKIESIEAEGGNPFMEYSVPEAVIKLRQGVGRLIRSEKDKGIVVILDNRVVTKRYGKTFLQALPNAPVKIVKQ